jgi:phosphoribosylformylglycinamidine cyclo-ligase
MRMVSRDAYKVHVVYPRHVARARALFRAVSAAPGAGTKSSLAYMYWKETGDLSVWKGIAQDALIMNLDDLLCVGVTDNILLSSTIGRNKNLIPG